MGVGEGRRDVSGGKGRPFTGDGKTGKGAKIKPVFQGEVGKATGGSRVVGGRASRLRAIADVITGKHRKGR